MKKSRHVIMALACVAGILYPGGSAAAPKVAPAGAVAEEKAVGGNSPYTGPAIKHKRSIYEFTDVVAGPSAHTVVPKGGVLFAPKGMRDRIPAKPPQTKFLNWWDFYRTNGQWIITEKLTLDQAAGKAPISATRKDAIVKANRVVIAVFNDNPIGFNGEKIVDPSEPVVKNPAKAAPAGAPVVTEPAAKPIPKGFPGKEPQP